MIDKDLESTLFYYDLFQLKAFNVTSKSSDAISEISFVASEVSDTASEISFGVSEYSDTIYF